MKKNPAGNKNFANRKNAAKGRTEKDIDDLVHSNEEEIPEESGEQDPDDIIHQPAKRPPASENDNMEDPDDLVHGLDDDHDDRS